MESISIDYLANQQQHIPALAQWQQSQWSDISPHLTTQKRIDFMRSHPAMANIPTTCIALLNNELMGSASLVENDMEDYADYGPWLASVYVTHKHRKKGAATALVEEIIMQAKLLNYDRLFLFTADQHDFYALRGWKSLHQTRYHGESIDIMFFKT
jgi:N-acetylglutamate synthase-like GNAT family acetyltransferase